MRGRFITWRWWSASQGHLDAAIADLREVTAQFPRSRDAHRELGFSFYQQHKYQEARTEYETLQSIDPDDLAAHYILSIVYRRLGMKEQASARGSGICRSEGRSDGQHLCAGVFCASIQNCLGKRAVAYAQRRTSEHTVGGGGGDQ